MPTIQIEADLSPEQLLNAARQLPRREFDRFVNQVLRLRAERIAPSLSATESELLMKINQGLPPAIQERLNELIKKRRAETITAKELRELKKLTDQVEKLDAERLKWLTELAALRNVPLRKLIKQLGLKPVPHD
jgi:hypothetical protein